MWFCLSVSLFVCMSACLSGFSHFCAHIYTSGSAAKSLCDLFTQVIKKHVPLLCNFHAPAAQSKLYCQLYKCSEGKSATLRKDQGCRTIRRFVYICSLVLFVYLSFDDFPFSFPPPALPVTQYSIVSFQTGLNPPTLFHS